jgi:AP2-associated kinase
MGMPAGYGANPPLPIPPQQTPQQKYKGTLAPGTIIKVGDAQVRIERYLSEGGYAHVYLTTSDRPVYPPSVGGGGGGTASKGRWGEKGYSQHCLKRIAFEDEKVWVDVRQEIEVMVSSRSFLRWTFEGAG